MRRLYCIFETSIFALVLTSPALPAPIYNITNLGNLGGNDITVTGINKKGQVTGYGLTSLGDYRAYLWSSGVMSDLGVNASSFQSQAGGINNSGVVAGTQTGNSGTQAVYWSGGAYTPLGGVGTSASAINDAGQIAGLLTSSNSQGHAFRTSGGVMQDLGTIGGGTWSSAYGINSAGSVVGYGATANGNFLGFVTDAAGHMTTLGTLGGSNSNAMAINDAGKVAGSSATRSGYFHATEWSNGSILDLGTLGGGNSFAYGINSLDMIVGYSYLANSPDSHAFVYRDGVLYDLNGMIPSAAGWTLLNAYAINDRGQIAGTGLLNGQVNAFLLSPQSHPPLHLPDPSAVPEPDTIVFAALGLTLIAALKLISNRRKIPILLPPHKENPHP